MSSKQQIICPACGAGMEVFRNPVPTVDILIEVAGEAARRHIVLIKRKNPPFGWAIPGGFVDYGESVESAALREAKEETGLDVQLRYLLGVYSDGDRDPRQHTISTVFVGQADGRPRAGDDAAEVGVFDLGHIPDDLAFDHNLIIRDYLERGPAQMGTAGSP